LSPFPFGLAVRKVRAFKRNPFLSSHSVRPADMRDRVPIRFDFSARPSCRLIGRYVL